MTEAPDPIQTVDEIAPIEARPAEEGTPPEVADGIERRLDPRVITLHRTTGWVGVGLLFFVGSLVVGSTAIAALAGAATLMRAVAVALAWAVAIVALAWRAQAWPLLAYRHAAYRVDQLGIGIRRGVLWRRHLVVPRTRVQHTDVSQGPIERAFGLGTLVIFTAGTDHARVELPGLDHATALRIRNHLLPDRGGDAV